MKLDRLGRRAKLSIVAALVTFSVLAGTGVGWAYWSAQATSTATLGAGTLTISSAGFGAQTLRNENIVAAGSTTLRTTGSISVTNTTVTSSTQAQNVSVTFSRASGSAELAAATSLTVWSVTNPTSCTATATAPSGAQTKLWSETLTVSSPLASGSTVHYCVRNSAERQSIDHASGAWSFVPQAVASLSMHNFVGTHTHTGGAVGTQYIYPLQQISNSSWWFVKRAGTEWCWDVHSSGTAAGTQFISYECKPIGTGDLNQDFRYADPDGDGYGNFQPGHADAGNLRVTAANSTASGSAVDMRTVDAAAARQQWQPQLVSGSGSSGTYQFVNKHSGLCLSMPAASAAVGTQVTCSDGADQRFTLTLRSVVQLAGFQCQNDGGSGRSRSVVYAWGAGANSGPFTVEARESSSSSWMEIATASAPNAASAAVASPITAPLLTWGTGTYSVRVLDANEAVVATSSIRVYEQRDWWDFFGTNAYHYARCS